MDIKQNKVDDLNLELTITLHQSDFQENVTNILKDYRKKVSMPGFRKGMVPMNIIQKQYGESVTFDEINKLLSKSLNQYISDEKLNFLGQPLPKENPSLDIKAEELKFEFEIGLAPEFQIDLSSINLPYYNIKASVKEIDDAIQRIQMQYGKDAPIEEIQEDTSFQAKIEEDSENEEESDINKEVRLHLKDLKNKELFLGKKLGDVIEINAQDLFSDIHQLQHYFNLSHEEAHLFRNELKITIQEIFIRTKAELSQEIFDKIYGENKVTSEEELRNKIEEELNSYYKKESDSFFMNKVIDYLLSHTSFILPSEFLIKYIKTTTKDPLTEEQAKEEYNKSEKSIRYQLIESKVLSDHNIQLSYDEIFEYSKFQIKNQFLMYGHQEISNEDLEKYATNFLKDEDQRRRISNELLQQKLFNIFMDKVLKEEKDITLEEFDKLLKEENNKPE